MGPMSATIPEGALLPERLQKTRVNPRAVVGLMAAASCFSNPWGTDKTRLSTSPGQRGGQELGAIP
jgi:hypothetical protein